MLHATVVFPSGLLDLIGEIPDPHDRHVVAAAICAHARVIVTANLRHFPARVLELHGILACSPDEFLVKQLQSKPESIREILELQAENRGERLHDLIERFLPGMPRFVELLKHPLSGAAGSEFDR